MKRPALVATLFAFLLFGVVTSPALAASSQDYFDWGPYYLTSPKVLGFSFSSLEQLPSFTLPESAQPPSPGILPGNPLYPIERLAEGVQLAFTFNPEQKQLLNLSFATERLSEAQESINRGSPGNFSQAISNYENTLSAINRRLDQTPNVLSQVEEVLAGHAILLENISFSAPPTILGNLSSAIEVTHEALDSVSEVQGEPAIPESLSTSLQKLKDQGLITPEETEKLYGLESRSQVREEIEKLASVGFFPLAETTKLDSSIENHYPEIYEHTLNNLEFAELRTYQALPRPSDEISVRIENWLSGTSDTPPPPEIRPYLYTARARELAREIDFSQFALDQQAEVTKFYPEEATENPTYASETPVESPPEEATSSEELIRDYIPEPSGPIPGDFTYFGKRLFETFTLATTFNPERRLEYRMKLAEERLAEASQLYSDSDRSREYGNVLGRYQTEVGLISENLKNYPESPEREDLAKRLELQASRHEAVFEIGLIPPPDSNSQIIAEVIAETQKAMDRSADALGKPALPPALNYRLQDLKAQGVILEEEIADLTESTSREEVREKIKKLGEEGIIPPAEAKRLDEAQSLTIPTNFNQLIEVRKVEELQTLRTIQTELAQTPTLKSTNNTITSRVEGLLTSIDISLIDPIDLAGKNEFLAAYEELKDKASPRPNDEIRPEPSGLEVPKPVFATPESPFYFIKRSFEGVQSALAITPGLKAKVGLSQARERFAEAYDALSSGNEEDFQKVLGEYTKRVQSLYNDLGSRRLGDKAKQSIADSITETAIEQNLLLGKAKVLASEDSQTSISAAFSINLLGIDKAADIRGDPPIPDEVRQKIDGLTSEMVTDEKKTEILGAKSRVEARVGLTTLAIDGLLTPTETSFLNKPLAEADFNAQVKLEELQKLGEIITLKETGKEIGEKIKRNEDVVQKLGEFERTFEPGDSIDAEIRPFVRLTRIDEVAQTIRPDLVNLQNFGNRKDVQLAIATLQQEQKPTKEALRQVEDFRRRNPNAPLPPNLARIEALSFSLGVRDSAETCFLPSPPFPANTACPAPGAAIPFSSYYSSYQSGFPGIGGFGQSWQSPTQSVDENGKPLVYGQGPTPTSPGVCSNGYHWMYDSGGWCMTNTGNYPPQYSYTPTGPGPNYTPYSPYYTAPGAPPGTYGYPVGGSYSASNYAYGAPSYYGPAPSYYTTNPPSGTVPGSGPKPTAPGQCPGGYHWMSDSGGWCMADGGTYVPSGTYTPYPSGSPSSYTGGTGSSTGTGSCYPPSGGCGSGWFDYGKCSCQAASSQGCYNVSASSCGSGFYWDSSACTCRSSSTTSGGGGTSTTTSSSSGSCPSGYHWMSDNGGWCMADGGGSTTTSTSTQPAPAPTTETQPPPPSSEPAPPPQEPPPPSP